MKGEYRKQKEKTRDLAALILMLVLVALGFAFISHVQKECLEKNSGNIKLCV